MRSGQVVDPYLRTLAWDQDRGNRFPMMRLDDQRAAEVRREARRFQAIVPPTHPDFAIYPAPNIAGRRQGFGGYDMTLHDGLDPQGGVLADRRQQMAMLEGGRGPGTMMSRDMSELRRQRSGVVTTGFQVQVPPETPWMMLRCASGSAEVRVTAGSTQGGGETSRRFFLGGGFTGAFMLSAWDIVRVEVLDRDADATQVTFAWVQEGLQAGNVTLYYPQRLAAGTYVVPEGAYALVADQNDAGFTWTNPLIAGWTANVGLSSGVQQDVLGTIATFTAINDVTWFLRPI